MVKRSGFSLLELMIVLSLLGLLASIVTATHRNSTQKAKETVLRHNLVSLRSVFDQYNNDKGRYPESLDSLVDEGYLREIPVDPITRSRETWQVVFEEDFGDEDSSYEPGIFDVKSGSAEKALDGTYYYEW